MKLVKYLLIGIAVVLVAVIGAAWWIYASRDALVKQAIEEFGPQITGVTVKVSRVKLEPTEGKASIAGLAVGNPAGYNAPNSVTLGEMRLAIDASTLTSNVVHVKELVIDAPAVTYERGPGGDNLHAIQKHIDEEVAKLGGGKGEKKSEPKPASSGGKKFVIDNLYVRGAKIKYSDTVTMPMPDLHLRDVGKASNGASAGEITQKVWESITGSAGRLASSAGSAVTEGTKSAVDSVKSLFK